MPATSDRRTTVAAAGGVSRPPCAMTGESAVCGGLAGAVALATALAMIAGAACKPRPPGDDGGAPSAAAGAPVEPGPIRLHYPASPISFVALVADARPAAVSIR